MSSSLLASATKSSVNRPRKESGRSFLAKSFAGFIAPKSRKLLFGFISPISGIAKHPESNRPEIDSNPKEILVQLDRKYKSLPKQWPKENDQVEMISNEWLGGRNSEKAEHFLRTEYHEVEKMTNSLAIKW